MKKTTVLLAGMMSISSCSQITTNKSELAAMGTTAENDADVYVACVVNKSLDNASKNAVDVSSLVKLAGDACQPELDQYKSSQKAYLGAQVMMTAKPLQQSVDSLNERAQSEVGEALLAAADSAPAAASAGVATAVAAGAVSAAPAQPADGWNADQRVYLDCMEDQARKYSGVNESASVIADVAQSRCKSYMAGPGTAALEQEGRTVVMAMVLDAKLAGSGTPASQPGE